MRGRCFVKAISVVFAQVVLGLLIPRIAECATPYRAEVALQGVQEAHQAPPTSKTLQPIPTVKVSGRSRTLGFFDARFTLRRNKTWSSTIERNGKREADTIVPVLLRGKVAVGGGTPRTGRRVYRTAASIINNQLKITFPGKATGARKSRQRVYTIRISLDGSVKVTAKVSSVPASAFRRGACGAAVGAGAAAHLEHEDPDGSFPTIPEEESTPVGSVEETTPVLARTLTLSTDADPEWYARHGDQSNAVIASIINTAETLYHRQLGLRFRIVKQHVYTSNSPYSSTEAGTLLKQFTNNGSNRDNLGSGGADFHEEVDLKHLFTGKDIDGSVIGIAYIGTVCAAPSLAFGVTQHYLDAANPGIFAHELGHNFGAFHDTSDRTGLMYPSISIPPSDHFSTLSLAEVQQHLAANGSCISSEYMTPRPDTPDVIPPQPTPDTTPVTIQLRRGRAGSAKDPLVRLSGVVLGASGAPIAGVPLSLVVSETKVTTVTTNAAGKYQFLVRFSMPRGHASYAYVETADGRLSSNFLWVKPTTPSARTARRSRG
jgi:hypothetical protein